MELIHNIDGGWYHDRCRSPSPGEEATTYTEPEINGYANGMAMVCDHWDVRESQCQFARPLTDVAAPVTGFPVSAARKAAQQSG